MICKQMEAGSTKGTILYAGEKKDAELIIANDCFGKPKSIATQFKHVQQLNTRTEEKNKTFHSTIALHPNDIYKLSKEQEINIIQDYAKALNLDKNQYVAYKHTDSKSRHPHFHFVANRINEETRKATNLGFYRIKHLEFCEEQEKKYNLVVANRRDVKKKVENKEVKKYFIDTENKFKPNNSQLDELRPIVEKNIKESKSIDDFIKRMEKDKITTYLKGTGIAFMISEKYKTQKEKATIIKVNGSKLGRAFSLKGIEKQIEVQNIKKLQEVKVQKPKIGRKIVGKMVVGKGLNEEELERLNNGETIVVGRIRNNEIKSFTISYDREKEKSTVLRGGNLTPEEKEKLAREHVQELQQLKTKPTIETEEEQNLKNQKIREELRQKKLEQLQNKKASIQALNENQRILMAIRFHLDNDYKNKIKNISLYKGFQNALFVAFKEKTGINLSQNEIEKVHKEVRSLGKKRGIER